ncbi:RNA-directed DNA polymerase, partial [Enterobacter hormaechei]|nr:RNA-directed DNA polymerase [Enterobacter hormaechei]
PKGFPAQAKKCIRSHGLTSKDKKERFYPSSEGKLLTGIVIQDGELKVRWAHYDSIGKEFATLADAKDNAAKIIHLEKLAGKLHAAGQVDFRQKDRARFFTQQLRAAKKQSTQDS